MAVLELVLIALGVGIVIGFLVTKRKHPKAVITLDQSDDGVSVACRFTPPMLEDSPLPLQEVAMHIMGILPELLEKYYNAEERSSEPVDQERAEREAREEEKRREEEP